MILLPAIDLKNGQCVRLFQGDFATATVVADSPIETAKKFEATGAEWLHMVDLDGAKDGKPVNAEIIFEVRKHVTMGIEVGGGIRNMETIDYYMDNGIDRVILGSAALEDFEFLKKAIAKYGKKIAVGIDARDGKVSVNGWLDQSEEDYIDFAKRVDSLGVKYIILTDIGKDGTMSGPNLAMLDRMNHAVSCNVIASGGVSSIMDIVNLYDLGLYGVIIGKSVYANTLDLKLAIAACQQISKKSIKQDEYVSDYLLRYFKKSDLIPAVIQEKQTGTVLMVAYMNCESLEKSILTGNTWFYSRSRKTLWKKGETSGNIQKIISIHADCDDDTLLIQVEQTGPACHTGSHSCFFKKVMKFDEEEES